MNLKLEQNEGNGERKILCSLQYQGITITELLLIKLGSYVYKVLVQLRPSV